MKIALFEVGEEEKKNYFSQNLSGHELIFYEDCLDEENLPEVNDFDVISTFVSSRITPKVINNFPNLKHIAIRSTGFDNIDINFAASKNISVSNVPAYGSKTVAEFTFGLILNLSRKIYAGVNRLKVGNEFNFEGLRGFDLNGKTLGVVGTGKIGTNVIKIAKGFDMQILAYDAFPNQQLAQTYNFEYTDLDKLLQTSDIITLHVPSTPETFHLINKDNIFKIKKGALLVNTSRGAVIETEGLFQAIIQEHLAGAALDVLEEEKELKEEMELLAKDNISPKEYKKIIEDHLLIHLPQVIVTPHMAFYTKEAEFSIMETTVKNILGVLGNNPQNLVKSEEKVEIQSPPNADILPNVPAAEDNLILNHPPQVQQPDLQ